MLRFTPISGDWRTIVGVVGNTQDGGLDAEPRPVVFMPFAQELALGGGLVIRADSNVAALAAAATRIVRRIAPTAPIENVMTIAQIKDQSVSPRRLNAVLISSFGILAVIIAAVGIAGVLAFSVSARTNEIGIRMSLGADSGRVQRMILREGGVLLAIGLVLGVAGAFFARARHSRAALRRRAARPGHVRRRRGDDGGDRDRRVLDSGASRGADRSGDHHAFVSSRELPMTTTHLILRNLHIAAGLLTLVSGVAAMTLRKGSPLHRRAGNAFFVSMLVLSAAGVVLSTMNTPNMGNIMGGTTAFYMVATAWATVIRPPGRIGRFEIASAIAGFAIALGASSLGVLALNSPKGLFAGYPPLMYFIFAGVLFVAAAMDTRMVARGGLTGTPRTSRHLSRMCLAFFMATGSFFFGQPAFLPDIVRETALRPILGLFPLVLLVYWMLRVRVWPVIRKARTVPLARAHS